ncbi:WAT1-related protein At3g28050-like [Cucurbita maxima]|uniref:WAT1-related protein At3g28050-like n=1 Tax=Cucurbita maxima TaxID=3661 RepID=A0A6J1K0T1_CUCMA|nr:WAT1-related protein At3g28050-like [Cucurbita maxima]
MFFFTFFVTVQTAAFAVVINTKATVWQVRPDIEMVTIVFSAIFGSMVRTGVHTWCLQRKGPVFVAMFKPLGMVIAVALAVSFLRESLCLGSVIGSVVIGCGFYSVIWGQIKQLELDLDLPPPSTSESPSASLLHHSSLQHTQDNNFGTSLVGRV